MKNLLSDSFANWAMALDASARFIFPETPKRSESLAEFFAARSTVTTR